MVSGLADPFGTAALREGVLAAWRGSPTRLREDAATEADLVRAGYRDRVLTELAQNAADAAAKAGVAGRIAVWLTDGRLHIANTGVPLDVSGVHALTALRASAKTGADTAVGRFGVGFTAVLSIADEIEFRSTGGSVRFSRADTRQALRESGIRIPDTEHPFEPPALRLAWPTEHTPVPDFDTEIILTPRADVDTPALLASMRAEALDLLLELPALHSIRIESDEFTSTVTDLPAPAPVSRGGDGNGPARAHVVLDDVEHADGYGVPIDRAAHANAFQPAVAEKTAHSAVHGGAGSDRAVGGLQEVRITGPRGEVRRWWQFRTGRARWLLPLRDGRPVAAAPDVLRAPTRSDEELSLPVLLIADIPMQPDRRRLLPGARIAELASGYADFARALPARDRLLLVPTPGFARSEADGLLREALVEELGEQPWLPVLHAQPEDEPVPAAADLAVVAVERPRRASVFIGVTDELAGLLAEIVGPLVVPELSGRSTADALSVLDVHRIGLARIAELSGSVERAPQWWYSLYDALEPFVGDPLAVEELGALAVPLADGRMVTGPRTVVLDDHLESAVPVHWARLVHPEAAHPLLGRLGARPAGPEELLRDPALHAQLEHDPADPDTVEAVLNLAAHANPGAGIVEPDSGATDPVRGEPAAPVPGLLPTWLGLLEIPDDTGDLVPADELLLPDAPLARVLVEDSPFGTVADDLVRRYGPTALRAVGVGWGFTVVAESDPTGPDHHLDDEETWWETLAEDPPELLAVRDLDLVDPEQWPRALRLLLADPATRPLLADRDGYTAWWLRTHARIDGTALGLFRHPADPVFAGLLPVLSMDTETDAADIDAADTDALRAVLADPEIITPELAAELLAALADPSRHPTAEAISRTHERLAAATAAGRLDLDDLVLPERVRALSGAVIDAADALVLDLPWYGLALPPDRLVVGDIDSASQLATLLDLPLASQAVTARVEGTGRRTTWSAEPLGVLWRMQSGQPTPAGDLVVHDELRVRLSGAYEATVTVPWWRDGADTHVVSQPRPAH
ncbi:sacsin N-terminal ATP-binding-like domain-containing protein [Nocardia otitidiscaviarum]|uniref:sacsin N-terminal ATP-binding-like domain-containing protein n=1 Tax=Nocardia otitidiscaviarum TaxID=1823 RepID=UPI001E2DA2FC|nr:ATP-binding protein [Nocardia otitidiscaviarum]